MVGTTAPLLLAPPPPPPSASRLSLKTSCSLIVAGGSNAARARLQHARGLVLVPAVATRSTDAGSGQLEEELDDEHFVEVGVVISKHGVRGELLVRSSTDFPKERFEKPGLRWLRVPHQGKHRIEPVQLLSGRIRPGKLPCWLVSLKSVTTPEQAALLVGSSMLVKREERPALEEGEFYTPELKGMEVAVQSTGETVGVVDDVFNFGAQDVLRVRRTDGPLIWIPFVEAIVPEVDMTQRKMLINPPDGLLDLNLPKSSGSGARPFTLSTLRPLLTEALPIPKLVLSGRLPSQHDATVNLDVNAGSIADLTSWPEFHNGVAAGMRLAPGQAKITRTWIVYNKPDEPSYEHAGFLMSLGLHKHLAVLGATDVFRYLAQEHDPTTVGILLGMAAAHRGSMDPAISKMLYLHIPARHPPSFPELELSSLLQSAALMAVGLLYQASAHRLTTEILLAEIGRKPGNDSSLEREGYALAAGLALGLVTLGRGKEAWGLADLMIEDRLRYYMCGGSAVTEDHRWRFNAAGSYHHFQQKNLEDGSQTGGQVMEGSNVNLDVTAPGATLALGLMFMKTNDEAVAARLAIPDTHFALEYVRPDFILLRLVARSLILWDSVEASEHWIQSQIPSIVRQATARSVQSAEMEESLAYADLEALAQAHVNILAGACLSIGLRYAGTANAEAQQLLYHYALYFLKERKSSALAAAVGSGNDRVDCGTLETCLDIAVLSLAVVMAGTGHLETFKLLRYLRRRNETDGSTVYGNHMAISMAIGFLFLGGGLLTFSTDNGAVAALLISLYPRFPTSTNDHRCHLQAFRHLYVLATEPRCVQTLDVDTGLSVYVPLELTMRETKHFQETSFCRVSPCILPERSALKRLRVCGPRYWPQDIQFPPRGRTSGSETGLQDQDLFDSGMLYLYVKRKVGARSYADDPIGSRSLLSRALHRVSHVDNETTNTSDQSKVDELVSTFSSDPSLLAFAQLFCNLSGSNSTDGEFEEFCSSSLFECVSMDRPGLLQTYLSLYACVEAFVNIATGQGSSESTALNISLSLQSLKASLAYCEAAGHGHEAALKGQSLIQRTFLASLSKRVDDVLNEWSKASTTTTSQLVSYVKCSFVQGQGEEGDMNSDRRLMKALYLSWNSVPHPSLLNAALQKLCQVFRDPYGEGTNTVLPVLASLLPGTPTKTLLRISECVSFLRA